MFDYFYGQSGEMFSYFRVPKILFRDIKFKDLSTDAKTLYGILLDRMGLSVKNGWLDEQGRVYIIFPVQEVMDALGCADNKATKLFRELEKFGLIERKRRGLGKPNLIYVKNFADPRFRNRGKNGSGAADSAQQETAKSRGNKTEWNKTEGSEPDPFSSDAESEPDERTRLEAYFMQSLEVDLLLRVCPDEEDTIHQIVNLLVDSANTSEIQATKKPHNYHKIAVWQKDDRIRKSPLKFCVYYYSELEGDCQASIIAELCRLSVVFCVTLWHMRNSVWFCTRGEWACSPIVGEAARCCLGCFQNDFLS